jgi:arylsulfatase A-like enzyme
LGSDAVRLIAKHDRKQPLFLVPDLYRTAPYQAPHAYLDKGGTRVLALANWPGHIKTGTVVNTPIHMVDMFPTLVDLAGTSIQKAKALDGLNVWSAVTEGKPSPRTEVVYDIEPFRAAIREGDWKLVWQITLPSKVELFNLAQDPSESTNLADQHPQRVAELAEKAVPPLFLQEAFGATKRVLFGSVSLPNDDKALDATP